VRGFEIEKWGILPMEWFFKGKKVFICLLTDEGKRWDGMVVESQGWIAFSSFLSFLGVVGCVYISHVWKFKLEEGGLAYPTMLYKVFHLLQFGTIPPFEKNATFSP